MKYSFLDDEKKKLKWFTLLVGSVFVLILALNILTPIIADDYAYSFSRVTGGRVTGLKDIFLSQVDHYFYWGGRSVVHFLAQTFLFIGKPIFNILNSLVFVALTLIIYFMANGRKKINIPLYVFVTLAIFLFNPVFGQTMLWLIGACNYLWGTAIVFGFLLPIRLYLEKEFTVKKPFYALFFIAGILAGWCNENTSGAALLMVIFSIIYLKLHKRKTPIWLWISLLGIAIGFGVMILAPGNFVRMSNEVFEDNRHFLLKYGDRIVETSSQLFDYGIWLIIFSVVTLVFMFLEKVSKEKIILAFMFFIAALACNYAMILSVTIPERSFTGTLCFLILTASYCFSNLELVKAKRLAPVIISVMAILFFFEIIPGTYDVGIVYAKDRYRERAIIEMKESGISDIETYIIHPKTKYSALYLLSDYTPDPYMWINASAAKYYEVGTITAN